MAKPWTAGPRELLEHAVGHIDAGSPFDMRIALISIDNAVELMLKTYLSLPKRVRKTDGPSKKKLAETEGSFPALLDLFEEYGGIALAGIDLGDIEWYHRVRNQLYHSGNGITVDAQHVSAYLEISRILFGNIFEEKFDNESSISHDELGRIVRNWAKLENLIHEVAGSVGARDRSTSEAVQGLRRQGLLSSDDAEKINHLRSLRNDIIHSNKTPEKTKLKNISEEVFGKIISTLTLLT